MWIERKDGSIVNLDWVESIEIFNGDESCDVHNSSYDDPKEPFEIRAYVKGTDSWFDFGAFDTKEEAVQELKKIRSKIQPKIYDQYET